MMKNYVKPELFFESYELSQNIAACGWDFQNSSDPGNCYAEGDPAWGNPSEVRVFVEANSSCMTNLEGYCYENSADNVTMRIFQS